MTITKHEVNVQLNASVLNTPYLEVQDAKHKAKLLNTTLETKYSNSDIHVNGKRVTSGIEWVDVGASHTAYEHGDVTCTEGAGKFYLIEDTSTTVTFKTYDETWRTND